MSKMENLFTGTTTIPAPSNQHHSGSSLATTLRHRLSESTFEFIRKSSNCYSKQFWKTSETVLHLSHH
ncbi:hypothetical protein HanRHA438_Chr14g0675031 [Helianthus annuus]|nr:hypothetical protein HanRHA438_Chr14g0675031 [Helianthus annuus]